jgi:hypothetical protein
LHPESERKAADAIIVPADDIALGAARLGEGLDALADLARGIEPESAIGEDEEHRKHHGADRNLAHRRTIGARVRRVESEGVSSS